MNDATGSDALARKVRAWLEDGPTEAPQRAVEAAFLEIGTVDQQRHWRWPLTRPGAAGPLLAGATLASALVVAGLAAFGGGWLSSGDRGGTPATVTPSPAPTLRPVGNRFGAGALDPGTYRYVAFDPAFTFTVPGGTRLWLEPAHDEVAPMSDGRGIDVGRTAIVRRWLDVLDGYRPWIDACDPDLGRAQQNLRSVGDLVSWLRQHPGVSVGTPAGVTVGGFEATRVDVEGTDLCAATGPAVGGLPSPERAFAFAARSRHRIWVVHVPGRAIAIDAFAMNESDVAWLDTAEAIVGTMTFEVPR